MNPESNINKPPVLRDEPAAQRYEFIAKAGAKIFAGSNLTQEGIQVTDTDIELIHKFHEQVSPANPEHPWRVQKQEDLSWEDGQIVDPSYFANWEDPGGPLEHIRLCSKASTVILDELRKNLKDKKDVREEWQQETIEESENIDPRLLSAAGLLHDEGREITHIFLRNDLVGRRLLRRMGIRNDIISILPEESVMQTPPEEDMNRTIQRLQATAVIIRIADEFGKRFPSANRLYQPEDFNAGDRDTWAKNYTERAQSGWASDRKMRKMMQRHVDNVPRYFEALDNWIQAVSTTTLKDITTRINDKLAPELEPLPNKKGN